MPGELAVAVVAAACAPRDRHVLPREGEDQQRHQRVILDRRAAERFAQRIGAVVADHLNALVRDFGTGFRDRTNVVLVSAVRTG